ncbi:LAGLIDADG family homing endonuclease [Arthrobacter sp. IK3]|uniref:LAGLIDADG family homing endonuclease n=1 Tax=Arthrobacter sp. IK3 TaxID=3448169 RepID=UPI003EE03EF8
MTLTAVLTGTFRQPELRFEFPWGARMPKGGDAAKWIKNTVPGRRWDPDEKAWYINGTGINPDKFFSKHGIEVDYSEASGDLEGLDSLEPLWRPLVQRSRNFPHSAFVRHRLAGYDRVSGILGPGAVWDKKLKRFTVQLTDLIDETGPKRGLHFDDATFNDAVAALQTGSIPEHVRLAARELAASTGVDGDEQNVLSERTRELIDIVASHTGYLPKWFGLDLFPFQVAGAYAIVGGHRALCDAPGLGKCVVPETRILANGAYTPIGQLWDEHTAVTEPRPDYDGVGEIIELQPGQLTVQALNDDVTAASTVSASHLYRERISAPVKTIRTASGAEITATLPHKFLTSNGWASEIHVGDMIAVPDNTPFSASHPDTSLELARLMAWQIGEGYEHKAPRVEITNNDTERLLMLAEDLQAVARQIGITIPGTPAITKRGTKCPQLIFAATAWRRWLEDNGYSYGNLAAGKTIPPFIMGARLDVQREFLANYFSAEGSFSSKSGVLEIVSASRVLMLQLQAMLSRFGVAMNIADRQKCATNGTRVMRTYTIGVITGEDIVTFRSRVGFADDVKSARLNSYREAATSNITRRVPCIDVVKEIVATGIPSMAFSRSGSFTGSQARAGVARKAAEDVVSALREISDGSMRRRYEDETPHRWTRRALAGLDQFSVAQADEAIARIEAMMSPSVRWTKVTSVEFSDYDGWVYDLTVPDGHNYIAEGLWCHNTRQALAAAAIRRAERVVIVVPPLVVTNWCREALTALGKFYAPDHRNASVTSLDLTAGKKKSRKKAPEFPPYIVPIRAGKKVPDFPDRGVIVVADSLLASRPELLKELIRWSPDTALFDEVHRARNFSSGRATADRNLACSMDDMRVPVTGTPFLSNPAEVTNLLAIGGLLDQFFGGASKFLDRYTKQDRFGRHRPRQNMLADLEYRMTRDCWVRRNKGDVLKQLPQKLRTTRIVDIDPRGFHEAHEVLYEKIREWVKEFTRDGDVIGDEDIKKFAADRIDLITPLRAAAGVAKVPAAIEIVTDWMEQTTETAQDGTKTYTRPLVVWVHHQPVMEALVNAVPADLAGVGFIDGGTPEHKRQPMADKLQNGEIGVLFCSIGAAGFGITLTKSSDAIFVETDWTPANISQAEDRIHRIGQTETCIITTLMAVNTLDPHMRAILRNKAKDLNVLMPGADNNVTEMTANLNEDEGVYEETSGDDPELEKQFKSLGDILKRIVEDIVVEQNAGVRKRR